MPIAYEDAMELLVRWLRNLDHGSFGSYGYEVYLPALVRTYLRQQRVNPIQEEQQAYELISDFYAPAWDLCRRGILRPGIRKYGAQATPDGSSGNGYSITPFGRQWLSDVDRDTFVPTEPERFGQMLARYRERFGPGFQERGQEAIRCYGAHAYLACCAMCGAAAESILLATAIGKTGGEERVLHEYASANGRRKVENIILGQAQAGLQGEYRGYISLLKYWRDEASHGKPSAITDNEAFTALALLLRFAAFVNDRWEELTSRVN
jgi:hypothetical protein